MGTLTLTYCNKMIYKKFFDLARMLLYIQSNGGQIALFFEVADVGVSATGPTLWVGGCPSPKSPGGLFGGVMAETP